jgi:hypothetical protein
MWPAAPLGLLDFLIIGHDHLLQSLPDQLDLTVVYRPIILVLQDYWWEVIIINAWLVDINDYNVPDAAIVEYVAQIFY